MSVTILRVYTAVLVVLLIIAHRNVGRVARTNAFELNVVSGEVLTDILMLGAQKILRTPSAAPLAWDDSTGRMFLHGYLPTSWVGLSIGLNFQSMILKNQLFRWRHAQKTVSRRGGIELLARGNSLRKQKQWAHTHRRLHHYSTIFDRPRY